MNRRNAMFLLGLTALGGCGTSVPPRSGIADLGTLDDLLNLDPNPRRNEVVLIALSQVGLPYRWGGDSPTEGFDCSGLVVYVFQQALQANLPRTADAQARAGRGVGVKTLRPGDLVFFNTLRRRFSHVGIYAGNDRFVHAPAANELVRLDRMDLPYWRDRFNGGRRFIA